MSENHDSWEHVWAAKRNKQLATALAEGRRLLNASDNVEDTVAGALLLADLLTYARRFEEAEEYIDRVVEEHTDDAEPRLQYALHTLRGNLASSRGDYLAAETWFRKAVAVRDHTAPLILMAGAMWRQGRLGDAEAAYREALQKDGDVDEAMENLGYLFRALERNDEALATLRRAAEMDPGNRRIKTAIEDVKEAIAIGKRS